KLDKMNKEDVSDLNYNNPVKNLTMSHLSYQELLKLVYKLPEQCRLVFNLVAIEGYKHREVAEMLEVSEGTSKSQYSRARSLLQEMIANEEERYARQTIR
ncbi:MAG: sigma factor-like helix-turn-helix DNA-binding protein, partial [Bacteroidota bacterium]